MERPYVAGVDTSTQSCKVVIYDPVNNEIVRQGRASHPDGSEVHPDAWWSAFLEASQAAGGFDDVHALSVGGQQHGLVCLDKHGEVIRPALLWNDTRSADAALELVDEYGAEWWAQSTGLVPVASITVTKLRWLADHEPENAARIAAICLPHDWLTWKISGSTDLTSLTTDRSDASGTGYVTRNGDEYRYDILAAALRIDDERAQSIVLPRICSPNEIAGYGDPERDWGHFALGPGCGDNAGAALGIELNAGDALLSLGTSGVISVISERPVSDPSGLVTGFSDASGRWLPLACTLNASRIIDAMCAVTGLGYDEFDDAALSVNSSEGLKLIPYFEGERTPNLPDATASLEGMTLANSKPAYIARATVEGLLNLMGFALDAVRALDVPISRVVLIGGGAKSRAVRELATSILDVPVIVAPPAEYVALGAAKQAANLS